MSKQLFTKEYEDFLITGSEESINSLPSGSIQKEYFLIIRQLLKEDLTPQLEEKIEKFIDKISEEQTYRLKALHIFKKMKKNPEKKDEIIKEIKDLFRIGRVPNYTKPVKYNKTADMEKEEENEGEKLPHELKLENYVKTDKFIENIYQGKIIPDNNVYKKHFGNSTVELNLDFNKVPKDTLVKIFTNEKEFSKIQKSFRTFLKTAKLSYFKEVIQEIAKEAIKDQKKKESFQNFFRTEESFLLTEHIEYLLTLKDQFNFETLIPELIARKYPNQIQDKKERIKILKEIKTLLNGYKYKYDKMTRNVLLSILELNSDMNIYELDTFIEYIEVPMWDLSNIYNISPKSREQIKSNSRQRDLYAQVIPIDRNEERKLIEKYLKHFFLNEKIDFKKLSKYFNENYIKRFYSKMKFYAGDEEP